MVIIIEVTGEVNVTTEETPYYIRDYLIRKARQFNNDKGEKYLIKITVEEREA